MKNYRPSLNRLALLAKERPNLLAGPLDLYKEQEGLDDQQLAALLHCETEDIIRLALCERPRPTPHFGKDVERIAHYIHADFMQLARVIRAAESRAAFTTRANTSPPTMLAARDRIDETQESDDTAHVHSVQREQEHADG